MKNENHKQIGCIIMASGRSVRYGKNKLLEKLGKREVILHVASHLLEAGLEPLAVTRSESVKTVLDQEGFTCILHGGERKSDTIHEGIRHINKDVAGYLFMPGDQPLVLPDTLRRLCDYSRKNPGNVVRVGFGNTGGSPVLFPASYREDFLAYGGDAGGMEILKRKQISCDLVQASYPWELWDVDTPLMMEMVKKKYEQVFGQ